MSRKSLADGLMKRSGAMRLRSERIARADHAAQSHEMALEALRDWHLRRVDEALAKSDGMPVAQGALKRMRSVVERWALRPKTVALLLAIELRLANGEDIVDTPPKPSLRKFLQNRRPEWMRDQALLPKKPPGAK